MSTQKKTSLSTFLRERRLQAGLTQSAVAKKLGYTSPQFVSNWERGLSDPPIHTLRKLTTLYKIPLDEMYEITLEVTIQKVSAYLRKEFFGNNKKYG